MKHLALLREQLIQLVQNGVVDLASVVEPGVVGFGVAELVAVELGVVELELVELEVVGFGSVELEVVEPVVGVVLVVALAVKTAVVTLVVRCYGIELIVLNLVPVDILPY